MTGLTMLLMLEFRYNVKARCEPLQPPTDLSSQITKRSWKR